MHYRALQLLHVRFLFFDQHSKHWPIINLCVFDYDSKKKTLCWSGLTALIHNGRFQWAYCIFKPMLALQASILLSAFILLDYDIGFLLHLLVVIIKYFQQCLGLWGSCRPASPPKWNGFVSKSKNLVDMIGSIYPNLSFHLFKMKQWKS